MAEIDNKNDGNPDLADKSTGTQHGVPAGTADEESHGGYGGTDRLQGETAPLQQSTEKDAGKDI